MEQSRPAALILAAIALFGTGCVTSKPAVAPRMALDLSMEPPIRAYRISVIYTNQDDIGNPTDIAEIRATVRRGGHGDMEYWRWESYEHREYRYGLGPPAWASLDPAIGFDYLMRPVVVEPDYIKNLPNVDTMPRDLTGFRFYVNLIDLHMWDLYIALFLRTPTVRPTYEGQPLREIGDVFEIDLTALPIALLEWENVSSDFRMTAGTIHAMYLGTGVVGGEPTRIIWFQQEQTLQQNVWGLGMKMPYQGTNRFSGHLHLDRNDELVLASYREYVYSKVKAPMSQIVVVHSQRDYRIERLDDG